MSNIESIEQRRLTRQLSQLRSRLDQTLTVSPLTDMADSVDRQQRSAEQNLRWLDEAMDLLAQVGEAQQPDQARQTVEKIEQFLSKT